MDEIKYTRDEGLQRWLDDNWEEIVTDYIFSPTLEDLKELAKEGKQWFIYDNPFLLSKDKKIMYGYSSEDIEELKIPDSVEVYDNICIHEYDSRREYGVYIGENLREITKKNACFGLNVVYYGVNMKNRYFQDIDEMLYDITGEDLILFPSGRTSYYDEICIELERYYIQLPMNTKRITEFAFDMDLLPITLVIPDSVQEIDENAFYEEYDKGMYMTKEDIMMRTMVVSERFCEIINREWPIESHRRPNIIFY